MNGILRDHLHQPLPASDGCVSGHDRGRRTPRLRFSATLMALSLPLTAHSARGQQLVDQTTTRFPQPNLSEYSSQVAFGDVDHDGDLDIAFANGRGYNTATLMEKVRLFINDGTGHFSDETDARLGGIAGYGRDVEFGDVNNDGWLDIVVANDFATRPYLLMNNGDGFFTNVTTTNLPNINLGSPHVCLGDVDHDGDLDLYFPNGGRSRFGSGQNQLWMNNGQGVFVNETATRLPIQNVAQPMDCLFGDIDGDFDLDILVGNRASNSRLFMNNGSGVFTDVTAGRLPANGLTYSWDFGDIDGDGDLDAIGINSLPGSTREMIIVNDGLGFFTDMTAALIPGANNPAVDDNDSKFFDYDNDGDLDVIIASLGTTERICRNNGSGGFTLQSGVITAVADSSLDIEVGDLNGDGRLDVVTAQGESGSFVNRIFINNGPVDTRPPYFPAIEVIPDITDPVFAPGPYPVRVSIRDGMTSDRGFIAQRVKLVYRVDCSPPIEAVTRWMGHEMYRGVIPGAVPGARIIYWYEATDFSGNFAMSEEYSFAVLDPDSGNFDLDGDVDLFDVALFQNCFNGAGPITAVYCVRGDFDGDCDIELGDYQAFYGRFGD